MIGNDFVDPETGTVHPGFDQRVFTAAERGWIEAAVELKRAGWTLACAQRALELGVDTARLTIERTLGGAPRFRLDDTSLPGALSFSHHGRFVAAVWLQSNLAEVA